MKKARCGHATRAFWFVSALLNILYGTRVPGHSGTTAIKGSNHQPTTDGELVHDTSREVQLEDA